jgi:hypothetical protein
MDYHAANAARNDGSGVFLRLPHNIKKNKTLCLTFLPIPMDCHAANAARNDVKGEFVIINVVEQFNVFDGLARRLCRLAMTERRMKLLCYSLRSFLAMTEGVEFIFMIKQLIVTEHLVLLDCHVANTPSS